MESRIEANVIGSLIEKPQFFNETNEIVNEKDFKIDLYRQSFLTIKRMVERGMDVEITSLYLEMGRPGNISALVENQHDIVFEPPYYARQLRKRNLEDEIKRTAGEREFEVTKQRIGELEMLGKPATLFNIQKMIEEKPDHKEIFSTGYPDIDHYIKFQPTDLMVIAGRPSVGKSCLGTAILANMAENFPVALVSFEMSLQAIIKRLTLSYDFEKLNRINNKFHASSPSSFSISEVRKIMKDCVDKKGVRVVMVDYLQLMDPSKKQESRRLEITNIIRSLKEIAKEFMVGMIVVSSLSRGHDQSDHARPHMGMLRESGDIEYASDIVLMLHRVKGEKTTEVIIDKNRHGKAKKIVNLIWLEEKVMFGNYSWEDKTGTE